ncbi:MAG TPA: hypothetical protein VFI65_00050 [Streptosporangiaceae bacterium]|nr:hypothetical protein [Streptosporangiaceae bacterium]
MRRLFTMSMALGPALALVGALALPALARPDAAGLKAQTGTWRMIRTAGTASGYGLINGSLGRIWVGNGTGVQSITPKTSKVTNYKIKNFGGKVSYFEGNIATDNNGNVWLIGSIDHNLASVIVRFNPRTGQATRFNFPKSCTGFTVQSGTRHIYGSSDKHIWVLCDNGVIDRFASSGHSTLIKPLAGGWTYYSELTQGAKGTMWGVVFNNNLGSYGLAKVTPGGVRTVYKDPAGITSQIVVGNGTGKVDDVAACGSSKTCVNSVASNGKLKHIANYPWANNLIGEGYALSSTGVFWAIDVNPNAPLATNATYLLSVTPAGKAAIFLLKYPKPNNTYLDSVTGNPVVSGGSVYWEVSYPNTGQTFKFTPRR